MDNEKRLQNCNFIKTIFMISVVLYHCVLFWNGKWFASVETLILPSIGLKTISELLNTFHIYGFTLVSGYIFSYIKTEKKGYRNFFPFIKKKFTRLLVPYIFVCCVWVIPVALYFFHYDAATVFKRYILMIAPNQLWFLVMLFNVFCLSYPLSKLWDKNKTLLFLSVTLSFAIGTIGAKLFANIFQIWASLTYMLYFWIGFYLRQNSKSLLWKIPSMVYICTTGLLFVAMKFIPETNFFIYKLLILATKNILTIIGSITAFIVLQRVANHIKWENKVFCFISDKSMVIYLLHQQFIYFTLRLFNGMLNPWLHASLNFIISFGLSLFMAFILKKHKITRFIIGES